MSETPAVDPTAIDPQQFAVMVRDATDEQLEAGFTANRDVILGEIFKRMADHFDAAKAQGVDAVVDWKITGRQDGGHDRYQVTIRGGACTIERDGGETPRVTFELSPVNFVKLATNNESGPKLFLAGGLRIEGDLMFAATVQGFFAIPEAPGSQDAAPPPAADASAVGAETPESETTPPAG